MEIPDTLSMPEFVSLPVPAEPANVSVESAIRSNAVVTMHIGKAKIDIPETISTEFIKNLSESLPMLNDASGFKRIYIACGQTDLRRGIEGLASIIRFQFKLDPYDKDTLFLFCGKKNNRIKGLLWEGDGFLLLYKRLEAGAYSWPRNTSEALEITPQQYRLLMEGFSIVAKHPITELTNPPKGL